MILKQEIATWDNATGMNPLHDLPSQLSPGVLCNKFSYGDMLVESYALGGICVTELSEGPFDPLRYEKLIRRDFKNQYTAACKRLSMWWLKSKLLSSPDILDYDYILLRQFDTLIRPHITKKIIIDKITSTTKQLFNQKQPKSHIPLMYEMSGEHRTTIGQKPQSAVAASSYIPSYAYLLNRAAVELLKDDFYKSALIECDHYYKTIGQDNFTMGLPGVIMLKIAIKHDIEIIKMKAIVDDPINVRGTPALQHDYARLDRIKK